MAKAVINIKADRETKEKAQKVAKELGMPLSTVVNAYLKQFIRTKEVHFFVEGTLKKTVRKQLDKITEDVKRGRNLSPAFSSVEKAIEYLDAK